MTLSSLFGGGGASVLSPAVELCNAKVSWGGGATPSYPNECILYYVLAISFGGISASISVGGVEIWNVAQYGATAHLGGGRGFYCPNGFTGASANYAVNVFYKDLTL